MTVAELLRETREERGLTLEQLAHETRIPIDRLAAFERDGLPRNTGFYERAQIRTYGHALGLEQRRVLEALNHDLATAALGMLGILFAEQLAGFFRLDGETVALAATFIRWTSGFNAAFAAQPGSLVATERRHVARNPITVHPHGAGFQPLARDDKGY